MCHIGSDNDSCYRAAETPCVQCSVHGIVQQSGVEPSAVESSTFPHQHQEPASFSACSERYRRNGWSGRSLISLCGFVQSEERPSSAIQRTETEDVVRITTGSRNLDLRQFDSNRCVTCLALKTASQWLPVCRCIHYKQMNTVHQQTAA